MEQVREAVPMDKQENDRELLKQILSEAFLIAKNKRWLERKLERLRAERSSPSGLRPYGQAPGPKEKNEGPAGIVVKIAEIEERISLKDRQLEKVEQKITGIIACLPENSVEREICELRHVDLMRWEDIQNAIPMSRSQCYKRYNKAIALLLKDGSVQALIEQTRDFTDRLMRDENFSQKK